MKSSVIYSAAMLSLYSKIVFLIFNCLHGASSSYVDEYERQVPLIPSYLPESYMTVVEMIKAQGYPVEIYNITTPDFYMLQVFRIPSGRYNQQQQSNSTNPVLLIHGIFCSAAVFTNNFAHQSLAYILADAKFDVWMINFRGNVYSHSNTKIPSYSPQFWDFSFDEMADYDLPTFIDFVLNKTGHEQVYLIGHSMGTTVPFAMLSQHPEYNSKVKIFFSLGTTIYLKYARGLVPLLQNTGLIFDILNGVTSGEALPQTAVLTTFINTFCNGPLVVICEMAIQFILGDQVGCLNETRVPVYLSHFPTGSSIRNILHFFQVMKNQVFQKYDFGVPTNLKKYKQAKPPIYNMSNVIAPVHLFYIDEDFVGGRQDTELVASKLGTNAKVHRLEQAKCGHVWLVWGKETAQNGYPEIIEIMNAG